MSEKTKNIRIDYSKYEVDDVVETIADAIVFPIYIGRVVSLVVVFFLFLIGLLSYFFTGHYVFSLFFFLLSLVISIPSIVLVSGVRLIYTINQDINKIFDICVDTTKHIYDDSRLLYGQKQEGIPLSASFKDVFRGVSIYVIRPSLKKALKKKIKFMAVPFTFLIDQIFRLVIIGKQPEFNVVEDEQSNLGVETRLDNKVKKGGNKVANVTLRIITFPLYLALVIYGSINIFFVWLFSLIF